MTTLDLDLDLDRWQTDTNAGLSLFINRMCGQQRRRMRETFGGTMTADDYRDAIRKMLNGRPPKALDSASIDAVRVFKKIAADAKKAADSSKPTLTKLQQTHNALAAYYTEVVA